QYDQRNLDVFAEVAGAFQKRQRACAGDDLETVATEQARHLLVALRTGEHQRAAQQRDVVEIGSRGEVTHELLQRVQEADVHLPRPRNRGALLRHRRDLLVPQMQVDEALAGAGGRAVREHKPPLEAVHSGAKDAGRVGGEFGDGVPTAQRRARPGEGDGGTTSRPAAADSDDAGPLRAWRGETWRIPRTREGM